jgi:FlaA1/EpsC-like NDP-sugar epimerase
MRNRYVLLADVLAVAFSAYFAFVLRFDWYFFRYRSEFLGFLLAAIFLKPVTFYFLGMYRRYWRYSTVQDLLAVTFASSATSALMVGFVAVAQFLHLFEWFARSVLVIDGLITLICAGGIRMSVRVIGESVSKAQKPRGIGRAKRILIAGAGEAGTTVLREAHRNPQLGLEIVGFLDDDPVKHGKRIYGSPVLGALNQLARVVEANDVNEVVIAMPTARGHVVRALAETSRQAGIASRILPGVFELLDGKVDVGRLRRVEITDLLRRAPIVVQKESREYLAGRVVLVTGAGGSIGFELCRQVAHARPACLVLVGHGENSIFEAGARLRESYPDVKTYQVIVDIRNAPRLERIFEEHRPEVVLHAAAHKHVPLMEANTEEAATNNVLGTLNIVNAAVRCGTKRLIFISTDKAVRPTSVMGASKRLAEVIVRDVAKRHGRAFASVRFGNVLGSRGSVVPTFTRQIERGVPITITHPEMTRFFMTIPEAVHLVLQAGGLASCGELFALNMGEPVKIVDLAADLVRLSGLSPDEVPVVFTGLRPGEKLAEVLWEPDAVAAPTSNPDILHIIETDCITSDQLKEQLALFHAAAATGDALTIQAVLAQCVPTFTPQSFAGQAITN